MLHCFTLRHIKSQNQLDVKNMKSNCGWQQVVHATQSESPPSKTESSGRSRYIQVSCLKTVREITSLLFFICLALFSSGIGQTGLYKKERHSNSKIMRRRLHNIWWNGRNMWICPAKNRGGKKWCGWSSPSQNVTWQPLPVALQSRLRFHQAGVRHTLLGHEVKEALKVVA